LPYTSTPNKLRSGVVLRKLRAFSKQEVLAYVQPKHEVSV